MKSMRNSNIKYNGAGSLTSDTGRRIARIDDIITSF